MTSYDVKELRRINYIDILRDEAFGYVPGQTWTFENAGIMTTSLQKIKKLLRQLWMVKPLRIFGHPECVLIVTCILMLFPR